MVQRVVYGALPGGGYGLRVSRPGFDVLNPSLPPSQLSFDSGWDRTLKVFMSGSVAVPVATGAFQYTTVNFGRTFSTPPVCLAWVTNASGSFEDPNRVTFMDQSSIGFSSDWTNDPIYPACRIYTDRIEFLRRFNTGLGAYTARYVVLEGA